MISLLISLLVAPESFKVFEIYALYSIAAYLLICSLLVFMSIIRQMEDHLGIKAFSITPKQKLK